MAYVNFGRKNTRKEALASTNKDKIFFPTDDTCIVLGGKEYGGGGGGAFIVPDVELKCNDFVWDEGEECELNILPTQAVVNVTVTTDNPIVTVSNITRNGFTLSSSEPEEEETTPVNIEVRIESGSVVITKNASIKVRKRLLINGHEAINLELPSGTLWATCNIGAESPYNYAFTAFQWGETEGNQMSETQTDTNGRIYDADHYEYNTLKSSFYSTSGYDAAHEKWGGAWRMPTKQEFKELFDNCTNKWTTINDIAGLLFTSKINGKTLFFPACGQCNSSSLSSRGSYGLYWCSSFYTSSNAYNMYFLSSNVNPNSNNLRFRGCAVRAVL